MVSVGESEAKKYYDSNLDKFKFPKRVRASHILITANAQQIANQLKEENKEITEADLQAKVEKTMKELKQKAEKLQAQVKKAPTTFAKVATENSEEKSISMPSSSAISI